MKDILLFSLMLSGISARAETAIQFQPIFPIVCQKHDAPLVNQVDSITRVKETADSVTFRFKTYVGACAEGQFHVVNTITETASVSTLRNRIILFKKDAPVISSIQVVSSAMAVVELTFDKRSAFKKRDTSTYSMYFFPDGMHPPVFRTDAWGRTYVWYANDIRFPWNVILTKISATQTSMKVL